MTSYVMVSACCIVTQPKTRHAYVYTQVLLKLPQTLKACMVSYILLYYPGLQDNVEMLWNGITTFSVYYKALCTPQSV